MQEKEVWKDVKNYEGLYQVSNLGRVKSLRFNKEKIMSGRPDGSGYLLVPLRKDSKTLTKKIHKLVAMAFLGHIPNGHKLVIDHIDNNRLNNNLNNLQELSNRDNCVKNTSRGLSKYVGVSWMVKNRKWVSKIYINGKQIYLGSFIKEIDAHKAYQNKIKQLNDYESNR